MEEDKKLQSLLKDFGMQETSANFDNQLMQKIAVINQASNASKSLINQTLQRVLIFIFIVIITSLIIFSFLLKPDIFSQYVRITITQKMYTQIFSFLAAFWIVMLINIWYNKKTLQSYL